MIGQCFLKMRWEWVTYSEVYFGEPGVWRGEHALFGRGCHVACVCVGVVKVRKCHWSRDLTL